MIIGKKIKSHGVSDLFILLQIIVLLTYCLIEFASIKGVFWLNKDIREKWGDAYLSTVRFEVNTEETALEDFLKCKKELLATGRYETICFFHETFFTQSNGTESISVLELGQGMEKIMSPGVAQGRFLEESDYTDKEKKVVVGSDLAEQFQLQVGDRLEEHGVNATGTVIGILKRGERWLSYDVLEAQSMLLDNQILAPKTDGKVRMFYYGVLKKGENKAQAVQETNKIISGQNVVMAATDMEQELQENLEEKLGENMQWMVFTVAIFAMIALGTALVIYARLYQQKREIGIFMAMGYSHKRILGYQIGEMGILGVLGYVAAVFAAKLLLGNGTSDDLAGMITYSGQSLDTTIMLLTFLAIILILLPSFLMEIFGILRLQPRELIGGNDT